MIGAAFSDLGIALLICIAGGIGAALRLVLDSSIRTRLKSTYPVGTTVINLTGSLLLGLLTGLTTDHLVPQQYQLIIGTGLLGGYTTFSTYTGEVQQLVAAGTARTGLLYLAGTLAAALAAVYAGATLTRLATRHHTKRPTRPRRGEKR